MDHAEVVRQKTTERYLLDELIPEKREEFEEHFFDCMECALDVRAASLLVEQSKIVLAEDTGKTVAAVARPSRRTSGWAAWLRPGVVGPAFALLVLVVGYQNLALLPQLKEAASRPQLVADSATINAGTRGTGTKTVVAPRGSSFLLNVSIPPDGSYSRYIAELENPAGKLDWSVEIPASSVKDQWPITVPVANREAGTYSFVVRGITTAGESKEVSRTSVELQIQQ
jgi:hypothetical protein